MRVYQKGMMKAGGKPPAFILFGDFVNKTRPPELLNKTQFKDYLDTTIYLTVPKGKKEAITAHAEKQGESVNGFINRAITEAMERESGDMSD